MKMTRKLAERRKQAVLEHFIKHPDATGDEVQRLLTSGQLTGEKGPALSASMLYTLKRQAQDGRPAPTPIGDAAIRLSGVQVQLSADAVKQLRERAAEIQRLLSSLPGVTEVIVTRDGARVVRLAPTEEKL